MNEKPVLDSLAIALVRDALIKRILDLEKEKEEGKLFESNSQISVLLSFFLQLLENSQPRVGCVDKLIKLLFSLECMWTFVGLEFAAFASLLYKEKIMERSVGRGSVPYAESMLAMIGRGPTEKELLALAYKNRGAEAMYEKLIALAQKHHPRIVDKLRRFKSSYEDPLD